MKNIEFGKRLKESREAAELTQPEVCRRVGVKQGTLSQLESGKSARSTYTIALAKLYGVDADWLATGKGNPKPSKFDSNVLPAQIGETRIPLLNYVQAGIFTDMGTNFDTEGMEYLLTDLALSDRAFALQIRGDSMAPEFGEGDRVIIDCDVAPQPGDFVVARNGGEEATFKRYKLISLGEQAVFELVPLNENYPSMRSDQQHIQIIGVMVEHRKYRRKRF